MNKTVHKSTTGEFKPGAMIKGLIWALVITIFLGIVVSLLLQHTALSESLLNNFSTFIFFISMFLGATIGARIAGSKGLFHGLSVSMVYLILIVVTGLLWSPDTFTAGLVLKRTAYALVSGLLGGIVGIGLSAK